MGFFEEVDNRNIIHEDKINSSDSNNHKKVNEKQKREKIKANKVEFCGIKNLKCNCFLNCIIQLFFFIPIIRNKILHFEYLTDTSLFLKELRTMFLQLKNKIGPVDPTKLINSFGNEKIWFSQQQDVNECFKKFIEKLEIINLIEYFFDTIMDLFKGNIKSILVSEEIGYNSNTFDDFIEINLVVDGKKNIYESLCELQQATYFSGEDQVIIENHGPKDCIKFQKFKKLPPILNFCLLRFKYDEQSKKQIKINDKFEFPEILDLNKYVIEGESQIFYLFAVIVHIGEIDKGHYVIYINPNCENNWYKFDDNKVTKSLKEEAIGLNFGIEEKSSAYMLTYIRKKDAQAIFKE